MGLFSDRRVILAAGAGLALVLGVGIAYFFLTRAPATTEAPPASTGGLVVQTGRDDDAKLDPKRPLRCFVGGQFVGELTLDACARKNGVATGALDVGLDQSGALSASNGDTTAIVPLPPATQASASPSPDVVATPDQSPERTAQAAGECWRYGGGGDWRELSPELSLNACVAALYNGKCEPQGGAAYGRWEDKTLRLVPGRVEVSDDNRTFHTLTEAPAGCGAGPSG